MKESAATIGGAVGAREKQATPRSCLSEHACMHMPHARECGFSSSTTCLGNPL